jgi:hypothetical protein
LQCFAGILVHFGGKGKGIVDQGWAPHVIADGRSSDFLNVSENFTHALAEPVGFLIVTL